MPSQLFKEQFNPVSKGKRNGFDLSSRHVFSTKVGQILPVFKRMTIPGAEYSIDVRQLCRTLPISTAAFTRLSLNYDFYYVKTNDLYTSFNQFISMREDKQSSVQPDYSQLPSIHLWKPIYLAFISYLADRMRSFLNYACSRVYDGTGYVSGNDYGELFVSQAHIFEFFGLSGGTTTNDIKLGISESDSQKYAESRYLSVYSLHDPTFSLGSSILRSLDMLGYGNYLPYFEIFFQETIDHNLDSVSESSVLDFCDFYWLYNASTSPLALSSFVDTQGHITSTTGPFAGLLDQMLRDPDNLKVSLFPIAAYNKIFEQNYRNSFYDNKYVIAIDGLVDDPQFNDLDYVLTFNFDDLPSFNLGLNVSRDRNIIRILGIFSLKLHQYQKDLFSGVLPSTQFGNVSLLTPSPDFGALEICSSQDGSSNITTARAVVNGTLVGTSNTPIAKNPAYYRIQQNIDVLALRRAEALQRFNENRLRAGNRVRDNFRAHFGVTPNSEPLWDTTYLGSFRGNIDLNTIASTSNNSETQLGQLGSNGVGVVQGSKIHVKSSDFGYIIGVLYIDKPSEYDNFGIDRDLQLLDVYDYPFSELQNISLAPLDVITLNSRGFISNFTPADPSSYDEQIERLNILGYLPRFIEHKTDFDRVHGEFYSSIPWLSGSGDASFYDSPLPAWFRLGVFSPFVTPRQSVTFASQLGFLYCNPSSVDNIFVQKSDVDQSSDQFQINCQFDCYSTSNLSVLGLPY